MAIARFCGPNTSSEWFSLILGGGAGLQGTDSGEVLIGKGVESLVHMVSNGCCSSSTMGMSVKGCILGRVSSSCVLGLSWYFFGVNRVYWALTMTCCPCVQSREPFARVETSSTPFVCFRVDEKKVVRTNIVILEGMMSKGDDVMLGAGRGCMMKEEMALKGHCALMTTSCSHRQSWMVRVAPQVTIARPDMVERHLKGGKSNRG